MRFKDHATIVTGAASGIGAQIALLFAREGARLVLADRAPLADIADKARTCGAEVVAVNGDLGDRAFNDQIIDTAISQFNRLDILINNAGIGAIGGIETVDIAAAENVWKVNFFAPFYLSRRAIPIMRAQGGGVIQFTGALAGMYGTANAIAYSASKAALINLCKALAVEHGRDGIRSNCVSPGPVETPMLEEAMQAFHLSRNMFCDIAPTGRISTPEDIAAAHAFLASPEVRSITGHVLVVDNGMYAGMFAPAPAQ